MHVHCLHTWYFGGYKRESQILWSRSDKGVKLLTEPSLQSLKKKKKTESHYVAQAGLSLSSLRFDASQELGL